MSLSRVNGKTKQEVFKCSDGKLYVKAFARIQDMIILTKRGGEDGREEQTHLVLLGSCWCEGPANETGLVLVDQDARLSHRSLHRAAREELGVLQRQQMFIEKGR